MSYIEHGPRIFCIGKPSSEFPLNYGDYVLPRKRSEGRLKMYDSCSDIRAWSSNPIENSRYFRELAEHAPKPGKVVPFNVLIDNLIKMGSKTQEELDIVKKELEKYKSLKLTSEQKKDLKKLASSLDEENKESNQKGRSLSKIILDTFLSSSRDSETSCQSLSVMENNDVSIQVQPTVSEFGAQHNFVLEENCKSSTEFSSTTSDSTLRDGKSFCSVNSEFETTEISENEHEIDETNINRAIIIEKDSKIIALENEVEAKNAELEEKSEKIKDMRLSLRSIKNVLDQKCHEMEDLRTKVQILKFEKKKFQESLDNQSRVSEAQLDEINRLRYRVSEDDEIKIDLARQLEQMRRERDGLKRKTDVLQQKIKETNENLCGSEEEFRELFLSWQRTSEEHEKSKAKTMEVLKVLESEIEEKNSRIAEYEAQILNVEQEVGDMFVMLKTSLSEIEFIDKHVYEYNNNFDEKQNIILQTKETISNVNVLVKLLESERKDLQKQLDDIKNEKKNNVDNFKVCDAETYVNYESSTDYEETPMESEIEIGNLNLEEKENLPLISNLNSSQDRLESQESTIEMWNCSFDKKIDLAFESHVTTSILKIRQLTEAFKDAETVKMKEIGKLKYEIKKRDLEISKLRKQIVEEKSQSKGEGDYFEREKADREKRELELEDKIYTYEHKLLGVNNDIFTLRVKVQNLQEEKNLLLEKYQKAQQKVQFRIQELAAIEKYKKKVGDMQMRLRALQEENKNLLEELSEANAEIKRQKIQIQDLFDKKEEFENNICKYESEVQIKNNYIGNIKKENNTLVDKLLKAELNIATLEKLKFPNNRNIEELSELQKEVKILNEERSRLVDRNSTLKSDFLNYQEQNNELEREIENVMKENKNLRSSIDILKNQFEKMVDVEIKNKNAMKIDYSMKMMKNIALLRESYENKKLEEKEMKNITVEKSTSIDSEFELKFSKDLLKEKEKNHLENESRQKEDEIEKLKHELDERNLEIKNMEEKHKQTLITITRKKEEEMKNQRNIYDQKLKKLEDNFNSFNNWHSDGLSLGTEKWLTSLSVEELTNLYQKIFFMLPSDEFSKKMNNKQNNYLQEDMSEKQKLIEKIKEMEYQIQKLNQDTTFTVEELELKIQQERCKSAKLQKHLSSLTQNQRLNEVKKLKNRKQSLKSSYIDDVTFSKDPNFRYYSSDQDCIKTARSPYNQPGKTKNYFERKAFSSDESNDTRRKDFIHRCSASMRRK